MLKKRNDGLISLNIPFLVDICSKTVKIEHPVFHGHVLEAKIPPVIWFLTNEADFKQLQMNFEQMQNLFNSHLDMQHDKKMGGSSAPALLKGMTYEKVDKAKFSDLNGRINI